MITTFRPYKGLMPYDREDRDNFFGREQDCEILLGKILSHNFTLLYAGTGVGKSSLLSAGVIPELEDLDKENLDVAYHRTWMNNPEMAIKATVRQMLRRRKKIAEGDLSDFEDMSLTDFFDVCCDYSSDPLILVLDQFEELFRYHAARSYFPSFIEQLSGLITHRDLALTVVVSMREDFLAELSVFRGKVPALFQNHHRLQKLTLQQAEAAIVRPVQQANFGFHYEKALLDTLTTDLAEREKGLEAERQPAGAEPRLYASVEAPYLQIVCDALWQREQYNPGRLIRKSTYDAMGRARAIVERYFEETMETCTASERRLAARAFTFLVTDWGTKMAYPESVLARILRVKPETLRPVLHKLHQSRILREDQRLEGIWYELYHDVFAQIIEAWTHAYRERRRRARRLTTGVLVAVLLIALGIVGFQGYHIAEQRARIVRNEGVLRVENKLGADLMLTCLRHYRPGLSCSSETFPVTGGSIYLQGPADYFLTAIAPTGVPKSLRYPVYVQGFAHQVVLEVTAPPPQPPGMVYVPAGVFRMGDKNTNDMKGLANERPHHDVPLSGFFMDVYEVTNRHYGECVQAGACTPLSYRDRTCYNPAQPDVAPVFLEANHPAVCVTWTQAHAYCAHVEKRLPTEAEWEKAAAGPQSSLWPFGDAYDLGIVNVGESHIGATVPVGTYGPNGYELYDMGGNVTEWVEDWYDEAFYARPEASSANPVNQRKDSGRRVQRGGSWRHAAEGVRTTRRQWSRPDQASASVGFRCAQTPTIE